MNNTFLNGQISNHRASKNELVRRDVTAGNSVIYSPRISVSNYIYAAMSSSVYSLGNNASFASANDVPMPKVLFN